jgi:hypothetical protein
MLGRVAGGFCRQQPGFHQRHVNAVDLGPRKFDQRRPHHRARQAAKQHERLLHAVVHVSPRVGIEDAGERVDAVVEPPRLGKIGGLDRSEQGSLQIGDDAAAAGEEPVAAQHKGA